MDWYDRGQNYAEWEYPSLAHVLATLKKGQNVRHPITDIILEAKKYIIFDAPLGRLHRQTGSHLDICIHLQIPLDMALARRLIRDFRSPEKSKKDLVKELEFYLSHSRKLFFDDVLQKNADTIIDGTIPTEFQVKEIKKFLTKKSS